MTVGEAAEKLGLEILAGGEGLDREIHGVFCCDLLSLAMSRAKADDAWVTVMGNMNVVAVAALTDVACAIIAEGMNTDADTVEKALTQGVALLCSGLPVFETANAIYSLLNPERIV